MILKTVTPTFLKRLEKRANVLQEELTDLAEAISSMSSMLSWIGTDPAVYRVKPLPKEEQAINDTQLLLASIDDYGFKDLRSLRKEIAAMTNKLDKICDNMSARIQAARNAG